jgi:hypothetical protein
MRYYLDADTAGLSEPPSTRYSGWRENLIALFHLLQVLLVLRGTERFGVVVTLLTRIQEMLGSNRRLLQLRHFMFFLSPSKKYRDSLD